jgi:hypothetical protein
MPDVIQDRDLTDELRSVSTLGRIDYVDVATLKTSVRATPEAWARAVIEHAAGAPAQVFWRAIGVRLEPAGSPGCIGGWRIAARGDDWIVLETATWYATINAVGQLSERGVSLALLVRYDRPFARIAAPPITLFHRRGIAMLLRKAARHLAGA